ncbi:MAG TPA: hypothetical protein VF584_00815 [Longimicrobium sp.]|jgi:hypothetical protein
MSGGSQHEPVVRRNELARSLARSFAVGISVTVGFTILGYFAGIPEPLHVPVAVSAGFAIMAGGIHPAGTPNRWRRNLVAWSVPFAFMLLGSLFMNWWRGV